jgi:hypothetical protein
MTTRSGNRLTRGVMIVVAMEIAVLLQPAGKAAAQVSVPCTGDSAACGYLKLDQKGTDYQTGAHFILTYTLPAGHVRQAINLTLSIAPSKGDCSKSPRDTLANIDPSSPRSIDGYLCKLRATMERR